MLYLMNMPVADATGDFAVAVEQASYDPVDTLRILGSRYRLAAEICEDLASNLEVTATSFELGMLSGQVFIMTEDTDTLENASGVGIVTPVSYDSLQQNIFSESDDADAILESFLFEDNFYRY